jgi:hypothetical protein
MREVMKPVIEVLRRAYPAGIPQEDYYPLMAALGEAGMSVRAVAEAVGGYHDRDYVEFYSDANLATVEAARDPSRTRSVLAHLRELGLDQVLD